RLLKAGQARFLRRISAMKWLRRLVPASVFLTLVSWGTGQDLGPKKDVVLETISYYKDVRPIIQQHCQGCHQPAVAKGGYVMTSYADLFNKTDNDVAGIMPGNLTQSEVYQQIIPQKDKRPAMPRGKEVLSDREVAIVKKWIEQGAKDDTPASAK